MERKTIAIVDDRKNILVSYGELFRDEGYDVHCFSSGVDLINRLPSLEVDLVLLDIDLGRGIDGWAVQELIRGDQPNLRVMFMTAVAVKDEDEARGLEAGAADYIRKGGDPRVILARVRNELHPQMPAPRNGIAAPPADEQGQIVVGDLTLDPPCFSCLWKGRDVPLTVTEFRILEEMASTPGWVKTRGRLVAVAGREEYRAGERAVDSHIKRLRRKLRSVDAGFDEIRTHNGAGYSYRRGGEQP